MNKDNYLKRILQYNILSVDSKNISNVSAIIVSVFHVPTLLMIKKSGTSLINSSRLVDIFI